jgi:hypothetical protein
MNLLKYTDNNHVTDPVAVDDKARRLIARANIENYEAALKEAVGSERGEMDEINDNGLTEYFVGGSYIRELKIPAGVTIVSKIWNKERMWIIASGEVTFVTEMGKKRVKAPYTEIVPHGSKVALYTHEDTQWFAITGAESTNSEDVEKEVTVDNYKDCVYPWDKLEDKGEQV